MTFAVAVLLAAMSAADAVVRLLNAPSSCGKAVYEEAVSVVARDARAGKPLQQFVMGVTTDDRALAKRYLDASRGKIREMAEQKDNPLAWYLLSVESNNFEYLQRAAKGGNVQALNALGTIGVSEALARRGAGTNRVDSALRKCFDCFRKAAQQRDPNGFVNLGACFFGGIGCEKDMKAAVRCYEAAAAMGHPEAMDNLSAAYQLGHGVEPDAALSLWWAMRARALRGDRAASEWLRANGSPTP